MQATCAGHHVRQSNRNAPSWPISATSMPALRPINRGRCGVEDKWPALARQYRHVAAADWMDLSIQCRQMCAIRSYLGGSSTVIRPGLSREKNRDPMTRENRKIRCRGPDETGSSLFCTGWFDAARATWERAKPQGTRCLHGEPVSITS